MIDTRPIAARAWRRAATALSSLAIVLASLPIATVGVVSAADPPSFGAPVSVPAGTHAHGVAIADLDGDGILDLIATNAGSNDVSVRLGDGGGSFGAAATFATGQTPKMSAVGDVNGDDHPDLVSADQDASTISVLLGTGTGAFAARVAYPSCSRAHETALGDLDGDDDLDVVVACWNGSVASVLLGNGDGTFAARTDVATGSGPHSVVLGRFDGDTFLDAAIADRASDTVSILRGNGNGTFAARVAVAVGNAPHSIRAADLDGDDDVDLVTANDSAASVSVLLGDGAGAFAAAVAYPTGSVPKGVAIADVTGDGNPDVLTANTAGSYPTCCVAGGDTLSVLLGSGTGTLAAAVTRTVGQTPFAIATGDLDDDGDLDVATANWHSNDVTILENLTIDTPPVGDTTPPTLSAPTVRVGTATVATSSFAASLAWTASDSDSGLASFRILRSVDGGTETTVATLGPTTRSYVASVAPGRSYRFVVRATDVAGNTIDVDTGTIRPTLYTETTSLATYAGTWTRATSSGYLNGASKTSRRTAASVTFKANARAIAWVAPRGPTMGTAKVYVDGVLKATVNLYATSARTRQVAFQTGWATFGSHTVRIVLAGPSSRPRVDIDGFVVIR